MDPIPGIGKVDKTLTLDRPWAYGKAYYCLVLLKEHSNQMTLNDIPLYP